MTLLAEVVTTSRLVGETSSRSNKVAVLAELLRRLEPDEVPICVGFLSGAPRQGRVGVGYSTIYAIRRQPAAEPALTMIEVDGVIDEIERATGFGSARRRSELLADLLGRDRILGRAVERANADRRHAGLPSLPAITPHSLRRTWATFAASIGRDPKWIAAQIGHEDPEFTFSVYQQVATRRYIDAQAIWTVMRFADEPVERVDSRQLTRLAPDDPRARAGSEGGPPDSLPRDGSAPGEDR